MYASRCGNQHLPRHDARSFYVLMEGFDWIAIIKTLQSHVGDALHRVRELRLSELVYPVTTYFAAPDNSCKGIVPGHRACDYTVSSKTAETRHLRTPTKAEESRSKSRSESRHKSKARYKFRTRLQSRTRLKLRSCSKSHYCSSKESRHPLETRAPSPSTRPPYEKALQSKPVGKEVRAFSEQQRAPERNAIKVAPRELGQVEIPPTACSVKPITPHRVPSDH
ncbi:hypothetical protein MRX96_020490 [Rhipicephalus microplus]